MRKKQAYLAIALLLLIFVGCQKKDDDSSDGSIDKDIPKGVIDRLKALGYSIHGVIPYRDGYLVEGDMYITTAQLKRTTQRSVSSASINNLIIGTVAQYKTTNVVNGSSILNFRVIKVLMDPNVPATYFTALDNAIARYNNSGINLIFLRVTSDADISINVDNTLGAETYGGAEGPPSETGNPNSQIWINQTLLGTNPDQGFLTTFFAHEIGHCLGFRHTDYFDRSLSGCPYSSLLPGGYNEGSAGVGAVHIPGTPTGVDNESWMLACSSSTENRPFTAYDLIALRNLYPSNSSFCNSATYSISNLPPGASVSWAVSNTTLASVAPSGSAVTITRSAYGSANLLATVSFNGNSTVITKPIILGYKQPTITVNGGNTWGGSKFYVIGNTEPGTSYRLEVTTPSGSVYTALGEVSLDQLGKYWVRLYLTNSCVTEKLVHTSSFISVDDGGPIH